MRHIIADVSDIPPAHPLVDRRRTPDRRMVWRGGRRDSDWVNRPLNGLANLEGRQRRANALRKALLSVLHLW
jgi:hypothetical protein